MINEEMAFDPCKAKSMPKIFHPEAYTLFIEIDSKNFYGYYYYSCLTWTVKLFLTIYGSL
jgi:hypothetical protein